MPAKSEKQRRFMGAVLSQKMHPKKNASAKVKEAAKGMTMKQVHEYMKHEKHK